MTETFFIGNINEEGDGADTEMGGLTTTSGPQSDDSDDSDDSDTTSESSSSSASETYASMSGKAGNSLQICVGFLLLL